MKNSASEIFCLNHRAAYQHAFGFIRQLAIHLRNSMKLKTKVCYILINFIRPPRLDELTGIIQASLQLAICSCC